MKSAIILAAVLFSTTAFADDWSEKVVRRGNYTVDEINRASDFFGRPPLQSARVLHDDNKQEREYRSFIFSESNINSKSTITSK